MISDGGGPDILLHANVLRNFGQSSVADGARIEIDVQDTARGVQAVEVFKIEPPAGVEAAMLADFEDIDPEVMRSAPLEPSRVKWFDKVKGFGFANVFGSSDDIFLHMETLRDAGIPEVVPGQQLLARIRDLHRGHMAVQFCLPPPD